MLVNSSDRSGATLRESFLPRTTRSSGRICSQAREFGAEHWLDEDSFRFLKGAAGYIDAAVIRDHLAELPPEDLNWCLAELIEAIQEDADTFDDFISSQCNLTSPSRPASTIVPYLAKARPSPELNQTLALALTHHVDEVRGRASHLERRSNR
jgi:hypothetical protein